MAIRPRPRPHSPPSPSLLSSTSLHDALSLATIAFAPWLQPDRIKPIPRELRTVANTLDRLRAALSSSAAATSSSPGAPPLFDRVTASEAKTALIELRDIATRARAASATRPRIRLDWRNRRHTPRLFFHHTPSAAAASNSPHRSIFVSSPSSNPTIGQNHPSSSSHHYPLHHHHYHNQHVPLDLPFPTDDRKRVEAVAHRLDTLIQVALWKARHTLGEQEQTRVYRTTSCVPIANAVTAGRLAHRRGNNPYLRPRLGRTGRVFSNGDVPLPEDSAGSSSNPYHPYTHINAAAPSSPTVSQSPFSSSLSRRSPPWEFSLIESPITPLRSRSLQLVEDGQIVLAMWRGHRVSVRIMRDDERRFRMEADYLYSLGQCPNIPTLLGAHWEHTPSRKKQKQKHNAQKNVDVGYLVMEASNGISLDKLVRQSKISDTVTKIRLLERVIATLVFAQKLNPLLTHQDLHPGNILLIPSHSPISTPTTPNESIHMTNSFHANASSSPSPFHDPAPIFAAASTPNGHANFGQTQTHGQRTPFGVTMADSTTTTTTDASLQKTQSHSTIPDACTTIAEPALSMHLADLQGATDIQGAKPHVQSAGASSSVPTIPKSEENPLSVMERVALHNNIDSVSQLERERLRNNHSPRAAGKPEPLELDVDDGPAIMSGSDRPSPMPVLHPDADSSASISTSPESPEQPASPRSPTIGGVTTSTSTIATATTISPPARTVSQISMDDEQRDNVNMSMNASNMAAFTVKVMDFASVLESEGGRKQSSWEKYDIWAGYCPPEKVTRAMRQKLQARRDKQRERQSRNTQIKKVSKHDVNGHLNLPDSANTRVSKRGAGNIQPQYQRDRQQQQHRERSKTDVTDERTTFGPDILKSKPRSILTSKSKKPGILSTENDGATSTHDSANENDVSLESTTAQQDHDDVYIVTTRSSSTSHRQAPDSETYALFGDDHDHLGNHPGLGIDPDDERGPIEPEMANPGQHLRNWDNPALATNKTNHTNNNHVDHNFQYHHRQRHPSHRNAADNKLSRTRTHRLVGAALEDIRDRRPSWRASGDGRRSKRLSNLEGKDLERQKLEYYNGKSRIDVWSIGWLLYYMCTGQHPPRDSWTRKASLSERDMRDVPLECRDIVRMCVEPNILRRASLRDVKRLIDSKLQRLMFVKGVSLLECNREEAFLLLDKAVGIQSSVDFDQSHGKGQYLGGGTSGTGTGSSSRQQPSEDDQWLGHQRRDVKETAVGLNSKIRTALGCLPLVVVRRVEWEAAGRFFKMSDLEMQEIRRALVKGKWSKADVSGEGDAVRYLESHAKEGVSSAQSALGWIYRWGACGVKKDVKFAMELWQQAVESGSDAEACNGLGLVYHHGRDDIPVDGKKGRKYYEMAVEQGYTAAGVNLGVMLHDGAGDVKADGKMARRLYEMACRDGDSIAANNLGLLLQHGAPGVEVDTVSARAAYEAAIVRKERHHACRNLAELLWEGADGVRRERFLALDYFAMAINRGDACSRAVAISRLRRVVGNALEEDVGQTNKDDDDVKVVERAQQLLREVEALYC